MMICFLFTFTGLFLLFFLILLSALSIAVSVAIAVTITVAISIAIMFLINRRFVQHCAEETDTCILYLLLRLISLYPVCPSALHNKDSSVALLGDQQPSITRFSGGVSTIT